MNSNDRLTTAVRTALFVGAAAALAVPGAFAQEAAASAATGTTELQKIEVTGSIIPRTSVETAEPITVITAKEIQQSGLTNLGDVIRTLSADNSGTVPMAFSNGFAAGAIGVSLRGLTVNSTLVLIDGQRVANYGLQDDGQRSFPDLSTIPMNAVERVEVLKDGASSIYGADAIAGVINIILYPSWTGSKATAQVGTSQHGGGTQTSATFITGSGDLATNHYNAYMSFEYDKNQPIYNRDRWFPINACDYTSLGRTNICVGGSSVNGGGGSIYGTEAPAMITGTNPDGSPNLLTGKQAPGTVYSPIRTCPTPVTFPGTGASSGTGCTYNQIALYGQIQPQTTRYNIDGRVTVDFSPTTTGFLNASYSQMRMVADGGPRSLRSSSPTNTSNIVLPPVLPDGSLNPNNIFATDCEGVTAPGPAPGVYDPTCAYAKIYYLNGPALQHTVYANHNMRVLSNLSGAINENWNYSASLTLEHTWLDTNRNGFWNIPGLMNAVTNGTYNFLDPAANSADVLNSVAPPIHRVSTTNLDELSGHISGNLAELPGGPLALGVGGQWFYQSIDNPAMNPGNQTLGLGSAQTFGANNVAALFAELDAPLLPSLEVDLSAREDHYTDFGSAFSPKAGFKWTPLKELTFRGTYSRGFRAPGFAENGSSSSMGFVTYNPKAAFINEHCSTPVNSPGCTPDPYAQPFAIGLLSAANPDIKPERSRNYTLGMVFQPFSSFSGTVDYYNILKTNLISPPATSALMSAFFAGSPMPPGSVILDVADPLHPTSSLRPVQFNGFYTNQNELRTSGFDVNLRYTLPFANGNSWTSSFNGTDILTWCMTLQDGGPCVSMVGTQGPYNLSSGAGTPKYRWNWANTFATGAFSLTGTVYWTSGYFMSEPDLQGPDCASLGATGQPVPADCRVPAFWYLNLTGLWNISNNWSLTAGILNATDRKPPYDPIDYAGGGSGTYNPTYSQQGAIGRFYQLGLQVKF